MLYWSAASFRGDISSWKHVHFCRNYFFLSVRQKKGREREERRSWMKGAVAVRFALERGYQRSEQCASILITIIIKTDDDSLLSLTATVIVKERRAVSVWRGVDAAAAPAIRWRLLSRKGRTVETSYCVLQRHGSVIKGKWPEALGYRRKYLFTYYKKIKGEKVSKEKS